jgi:hypothetical protein
VGEGGEKSFGKRGKNENQALKTKISRSFDKFLRVMLYITHPCVSLLSKKKIDVTLKITFKFMIDHF